MRPTSLISTRLLPSFLTFATCGILSLGAHAATISVTNTSDSGAGSLRQAINEANATTEADSIVFDAEVFSTKKTISVGSGLPSVTAPLTLTGSAAGVTLSAPQPGSGVLVLAGNAIAVNIFNLTFANNDFCGVQNASGAALLISGCTFADTRNGVLTRASTTIRNCTFVRNSQFAISGSGSAIIDSCTIAGNNTGLAPFDTFTLSNSLLVGNTSNIDSEFLFEGTVSDGGHNIMTGTAAQAGLQTSDGVNGVVLQDNGGPTSTVALVEGGAAVDTGATGLVTDQRGSLRPALSAADIGAFELQKINNAPIASPDLYVTSEGIALVVGAPGVLGNDMDIDGDPLSVVLQTGPSHGFVMFNPDGSFFYQPNPGFSGTDSFTYSATDGELNSAPVTVTFNVMSVNKAPVVSNVKLVPSAPLSSDDLTVTFAVSDENNDQLSYKYVWKKGDVVIEGQNGATLPASETEDGDVITVTVTANDGKADSTPVKSEPVTIQNLAPTVQSLSPEEGSNRVGAKRTFTLTMSDGNGASDIKEAWLLVNTRLNWAEGATLIYVPDAETPTNGLLYLRRGDAFPAPVRVGEGASATDVLDNGAVRVLASEVSVTLSEDGNGLTLSIPATIRDGLVGNNKLFTRVVDHSGATDSAALPGDNGYRRFGAYTVTPQFNSEENSAPVLSALSPRVANTRIPATGVQLQTFVFYAKDDNGIGDLESLWFMVGKQANWTRSATFVYQPRTRRLFLRSDDGNSFIGGGQIGSAATIENAKVKVDLSKVQVIIYPDGKNIGLRLPLQAKSGLVGQNSVWLRAQDVKGATALNGDAQGFVPSGTWNVVQGVPSNGVASPSAGAS